MKREFSLFVRCGLLTIFIATLLAGAAFAAGPSEYLIWSFDFNGSVGGFAPEGDLVADSAGNLYGVVSSGGANDGGAVFQLVRPVPPSTGWTWNLLYNFTAGESGGSGPEGGVIFDSAGNLYGTTSFGGNADLGVVFELSPPAVAGDEWTETVLYNFKGGTADGESPRNSQGVVFDKSGNLYGVTLLGGTDYSEDKHCPTNGCGVIYELTPSTPGAEWTETVIHYFNGGQGAGGAGTPIFDAKGNLYGATQSGGTNDGGVAYKMIPPATTGGTWSYKVLYAFGSNPNDARYAQSSLTLHGDGVLYGAALGGVASHGTVFQLAPPAVVGGAWTETVLYNFGSVVNDGEFPYYNVIFDKAGNLYSTTFLGGGENPSQCNYGGCGTVFELSPPTTAGAAWTETILHSFPATGETGDGIAPGGGLIFGKNGVLMGVTEQGGKKNYGSVFGIVP
jgi:uncharacterized repeat protein (TIGR03803 family)